MAEQDNHGYATRGPIPERSAARRRRNKPGDGVEVEIVDLMEKISKEVEIPVAPEDWHPMARLLWEAIPASGQSLHYEPTDWVTAYIICETLSRELLPQFVGMRSTWNSDAEEMEQRPEFQTIPIKGGNLSSILKAFHVLMMTEGDRRRMRLELQRSKPDDGEAATVIPIREAKAGLL
jgi:hypothetical protein